MDVSCLPAGNLGGATTGFEQGIDALALLLMLHLGLRQGEVGARVARDVDAQGRILWIPEGKTENAARRLKVPDLVESTSVLARLVEDGWVENVYRLQVMNATESPQRYRIEADGLPGLVLSRATTVDLGPAEARWVAVALRMPPEAAQQFKAGAHPMQWRITRIGEGASDTLVEKSTFVLPR